MAKAPARPSTKRKTKTTRSTTKAAPKAAATPAAQPAPKVALTVVTDTPAAAAEAPGLVLRKKEFIERVVARSGAKRGDVRALTDALLDELGAALTGSETLVLPPLGKLRVTRSVDRDSAEMLMVKIRRPKPGKPANAAAQTADVQDDDADDAEDGAEA